MPAEKTVTEQNEMITGILTIAMLAAIQYSCKH